MAIAVDGTANGTIGITSTTWNHTVNSNTNGILIVAAQASQGTIGTISLNGTLMTSAINMNQSTNAAAAIWYYLAIIIVIVVVGIIIGMMLMSARLSIISCRSITTARRIINRLRSITIPWRRETVRRYNSC